MIVALKRLQIAWRVAQDIQAGQYVNLGVGAPVSCAQFAPADGSVVFHTENGVLGMGPAPEEDEFDWDLINAAKEPITLIPGGSYFHQADSFAMISGRHLDQAILGAYQVSEKGDLANWKISASAVPAVGGAMDLAVGAKSVRVMMDHVAKDGSPKILSECTYPLTGRQSVSRIYTSLAVIDVEAKGLVVREVVPSCSLDVLQNLTGARLHTEGDVSDLVVPERLLGA